MAGVPPKRATAFTFFVALTSQADTDIFQVNPTLAGGDAKVSIDGGALNNLTILPDVVPAAGKQVRVQLSIAEMTGDVIGVVFSDAAGNEWQDLYIEILTDTQQLASLVDDIWDEVVTSAAHFAANTTGEALTILRGLAQQNYVIDSTTYDANGFMTAGRIRLFTTKAAANAATDGGAGEGEIATFTVTGTAEGSPNTAVKLGRVVRE